MSVRICTSTVDHAIGDAFMDHVDTCDHCIIGRQLCAKGRALLDAEAQRAAVLAAPIPVLGRGGKA